VTSAVTLLTIANVVAHTAVKAPAATAALVTEKQQADKYKKSSPAIIAVV